MNDFGINAVNNYVRRSNEAFAIFVCNAFRKNLRLLVWVNQAEDFRKGSYF